MLAHLEKFPQQINEDLRLLYKRWGLTPNYLSNLLAGFNFNDDKRAIAFDKLYEKDKRILFQHDSQLINYGGLETLSLKAKSPSTHYVLVFARMDQYGLRPDRMQRIAQDPNSNYIFWNYPNIGESIGENRHIDDYISAGLQQINRLKIENVPAENITLQGENSGGHISY